MEDDRDASDELEGSAGDQPPSLMVEDFASCFVMTVGWWTQRSCLDFMHSSIGAKADRKCITVSMSCRMHYLS